MNIAVCIKQIPVSNDVTVDPVTHNLVRSSSEGMINPADLSALEEAIVLKEQTGGKVVVFSMGVPSTEKSLRTAMAMGCDEACLITDRALAGSDTVVTANVLAAAIQKYGVKFDLLFMGATSADGATGQVGPMIAEVLSVPHISDALSVTFDTNKPEKIQATKKYQSSMLRLAAELPALITVCFGSNTPRLATLRSEMAAKKKPLITYTCEDLNFSKAQVGVEGSPTIVVDSFAPESSKKAEFLEGNPKDLLNKILELIEKEKGIN